MVSKSLIISFFILILAIYGYSLPTQDEFESSTYEMMTKQWASTGTMFTSEDLSSSLQKTSTDREKVMNRTNSIDSSAQLRSIEIPQTTSSSEWAPERLTTSFPFLVQDETSFYPITTMETSTVFNNRMMMNTVTYENLSTSNTTDTNHVSTNQTSPSQIGITGSSMTSSTVRPQTSIEEPSTSIDLFAQSTGLFSESSDVSTAIKNLVNYHTERFRNTQFGHMMNLQNHWHQNHNLFLPVESMSLGRLSIVEAPMAVTRVFTPILYPTAMNNEEFQYKSQSLSEDEEQSIIQTS